MIIIIFLFYLLIRLYPYIFSSVPLGYDPGLYLYLWQQYSHISVMKFSSLPRWLVEVYPPTIAFIGKLASPMISPEELVIPISFIISGLLLLSIYLYSKEKFGGKVTFWVLLFLATSIIQYKFWWWYYIKNILALSFVFFYLFFDLKKSKLRYILIPLVVLTHQPTAILLFLIMCLQRKWIDISIFMATFLAYYIPNYTATIKPFLGGVTSTINEASGTFYDLPQSLLFMTIYLPFTVHGLYISLKSKSTRMLGIICLIMLTASALGVYLSRRYIPFFEIFSIILAGISANIFFAKYPRLKPVYIVMLLITICIFVYTSSSAAINEDEFKEIKLLSTTENTSYILITDNEYTPWIYGYSGRKSIAPGFGEYDIYWSKEEWQKYWMSGNVDTEVSLLKKLPKPLYIWKGDRNAQTKFSIDGPCFERFSWHAYRFTCQ